LANPPTSTPHHRGIPLPPPVSPLIYPLFGVLNRGVNAVTEIFPEKIREMGSRGHFQKKKFPKIFGNIYILNNINR